jgi:hypothetical protein
MNRLPFCMSQRVVSHRRRDHVERLLPAIALDRISPLPDGRGSDDKPRQRGKTKGEEGDATQ